MKNIQVRVDDRLKEQTDKIFEQIGTTTNDAIKMFLVASARENGFPFELKVREPKTKEAYVASKKISLSPSQMKNALDMLIVDGEYHKDVEFGAVFEETVTVSGFTQDDDEETALAESQIYMFDTMVDNFEEAADSISGDVDWVATGMSSDDSQSIKNTQVAIIDEFTMFIENATVSDRLAILDGIFNYLAGRGVTIVGFCNAAIWYTDSPEEQKALSKAIEKTNFEKIRSSDQWASVSFSVQI